MSNEQVKEVKSEAVDSKPADSKIDVKSIEIMRQKAADELESYIKKNSLELNDSDRKIIIERTLNQVDYSFLEEKLAEAAKPKNNKVSTWVDRFLQAGVTVIVFAATAAIASKASKSEILSKGKSHAKKAA